MTERFGFAALNPQASVEETLEDIRRIVQRAQLDDGGTAARPVGYSAPSTAHDDVDLRVLAAHRELVKAMHGLQVELLALRRKAWTALLGPIPEDAGPSQVVRTDQVRRVQRSYEGWSDSDIAATEGLAARYVRELRNRRNGNGN